MLPTLVEVLALPAFRSAAVEVLAGEPEHAAIRWVHSSEVYEMGNLLSGGELLLTTGLGLSGRSADQLTAYVDQLADAGCVALAMEIGRSFFAIPADIVAAARRRGLVLLALHQVVPFERMIEDFHDLLVRRMSAGRVGESIWQDLLGTVVAQRGLPVLLDVVARLAGCECDVVDVDGRVLARSAHALGPPGSGSTLVDIRGPAGLLGQLRLQGSNTPHRLAVAGRATVSVALELTTESAAQQHPSPVEALLADIVAGLPTSTRDMAGRLSAAGLPVTPGEHVLVAAVDIDIRVSARDLVSPVRQAVAGVLGTCAVGSMGHEVIVLARGWPNPSLSRVRQVFCDAYRALASSPAAEDVRALGVAMPVTDLADVGKAIAEARGMVRVSRRLGIRSGVRLARDLGVPRLLASVTTGHRLAAFVDEQLGSLMSYDTQHAADLIRTLDVYLESGGRKSRTAQMLGIRRQSLYDRLTRIERLLGVHLDDTAQRLALGVAMVAWRLHTGLDPQAAFDRRGAAAVSRPDRP